MLHTLRGDRDVLQHPLDDETISSPQCFGTSSSYSSSSLFRCTHRAASSAYKTLWQAESRRGFLVCASRTWRLAGGIARWVHSCRRCSSWRAVSWLSKASWPQHGHQNVSVREARETPLRRRRRTSKTPCSSWSKTCVSEQPSTGRIVAPRNNACGSCGGTSASCM